MKPENMTCCPECSEVREALDYIAVWFAREMYEVMIMNFDPPAAFVDRVTAQMVCDPTLGWPDEDTARADLAANWPNWPDRT